MRAVCRTAQRPAAFAADQHQLRNAEAFSRAGAALLVTDTEMTGERLFREVTGGPVGIGQWAVIAAFAWTKPIV